MVCEYVTLLLLLCLVVSVKQMYIANLLLLSLLNGPLQYPGLNFDIISLYTELHGTGVIKLHEDGTPILDSIGRRVQVYEQRHIYTSSKIWTGMTKAYRRG